MEEIPRGHGEVILLVEDDITVLEVTKSILERLDYQVLTAPNGREALEMYDRRQDEIALVLTDVTMPDIGGMALAQALHKRNPAIKVVALTGYPLESEAKDLLNQGIVDWLQKPLNLKQLAQVVNRFLKFDKTIIL
jgi:CheY-like chemotaxis protein